MGRAYVFLRQTGQNMPLGILEAGGLRFRYAASWLARPDAFALAPDLPLGPGWFEFVGLPNVFRDQCPDRWGRKLMHMLAGKPNGSLSEFEILTAIHSPLRLGALAFGPTSAGPASMAPWACCEQPLTSIQEIREFAQALHEMDDPEDLDENEETVNVVSSGSRWQNLAILQAMAASVSLGGGRPKAMAVSGGERWIVKFSRSGDLWNEPQVEYASMRLAQACGLNCADCEIIDATALLVARFDVSAAGPRHMISGFTLRNLREDGDWGSYQQLAETARALGIRAAGPELFRRMVFNALLGNRDDHPRNHAFFFDADRSLTPAFDLLPFQGACGEPCLALDCGRQGRIVSRENVLSDIAPFGLGSAQAEAIIAGLEDRFGAWRAFFSSHGVGDRDLQKLSTRIMTRLP